MKRGVFLGGLLAVFVLFGWLAAANKKTVSEKPGKEIPLRKLRLRQPRVAGTVSLEEALAARHGVDEFSRQSVSLEQIGQLAWAGQGIIEKEKGSRAAPSAGAIYPITLYFAVKGGVYAYDPAGHSLEKLFVEDIRETLSTATSKQKAVSEAACDIVIAGSVKKLAGRYGRKARRFMLLEAGHISQNIQLQAVSLGLGSAPVWVFDEKKVARICRLGAGQEALYVIPVGYSVRAPAIRPAAGGARAPSRPIRRAPLQTPAEAEPKRVVFIIPGSRFAYDELFQTADVLVAAGVQVTMAGFEPGFIQSMSRGQVEITLLVYDIFVEDYDAIVLVGGARSRRYLDEAVISDVVRDTVGRGKIVAAIGAGTRILANAGVVLGLRVTGGLGERWNLQRAGAEYTGAAVEWDRLIITARGSRSASLFGRTIAQALAEREVQQQLYERSRGRPRVRSRF